MANNNDQCRVLVVDDDKDIRDLIKFMLRSFGAEVVGEAENGEEAVQAFDKYIPDITFLDIDMPVKNGFDALKEIKEKNPAAAVVMLSATSDIAVADACIESGARYYLRKGAAPEALKIMLKAQLESLSAEVRARQVHP